MSRFTNSNKNKGLPRSRFWYQNRPKFTTGFTLIELLVVISIIALLSSIVLGALNSARTKAKQAAQQVAIDQTKKALQLYWTDNGSFPASTTALVAGSYISAVDAGILTYNPTGCVGEVCADYTIAAVPLDGSGSTPPAEPSIMVFNWENWESLPINNPSGVYAYWKTQPNEMDPSVNDIYYSSGGAQLIYSGYNQGWMLYFDEGSQYGVWGDDVINLPKTLCLQSAWLCGDAQVDIRYN